MIFCPECGSILTPREIRGKKVIGCSCGYAAEDAQIVISERVKASERGVDVADATENNDVRPVVSETCPKCGHEESYTWDIQTRAGDEPATRFFECRKCRNKWREYR